LNYFVLPRDHVLRAYHGETNAPNFSWYKNWLVDSISAKLGVDGFIGNVQTYVEKGEIKNNISLRKDRLNRSLKKGRK
jgi:hypothetical protein